MTPIPEEAALRDAEDAKVAEALRFAGLKVSSVYDLVNTRARYPEAIPVLLGLLPSLSHRSVREGVVRALTVKEACGIAAKPLIEEFRKIGTEDRDQSLKWAIGNALQVVATEDDLAALIDLVREPRHGTSRQMLILALSRFRGPEVVNTLLVALEDDGLAGHAMSALKSLKATEAIPKVRTYVTHSSPWLRKVAKKTLERLESELTATPALKGR